jgi:tripartite ATP-independent transporter DctM subunit
MIPPSIGLILYGVLANVSIGRLFVAGIVPGILMCALLMLVVRHISVRRRYVPSRTRRASLPERARAIRDAGFALLIPIGIVGGLRFGVFTPTEAGAVAAVYATIIGAFVYRELSWRGFVQTIVETALLTGVVMMVISAANAFGFYLAWQQVPTTLAEAVLALTRDPTVFLLVLNAFLLVCGMFMDGAMMLVLLTPLLMPLVQSYGIDPVHFGIMFMLNLEIGAVTPPVGVVMYTAVSVTGVSVEAFTKQALPLFAALVAALLLVTFVPALSLALPNLFFH